MARAQQGVKEVEKPEDLDDFEEPVAKKSKKAREPATGKSRKRKMEESPDDVEESKKPKDLEDSVASCM